MSVLSQLREIDALYSDETKWTKKAFARDVRGKLVPAKSSTAVCFCLLGALQFLSPLETKEIEGIIDAFHAVLPKGSSPMYFNDAPETTFVQLKALIREAIKHEEGRINEHVRSSK